MSQYRYKLRTATLGLLDVRGKPTAVTIPRNSVLMSDQLLAESEQDRSLVKLQWEEKVVTVFATDVVERGELMSAACEA